jgi:hypothetical protein
MKNETRFYLNPLNPNLYTLTPEYYSLTPSPLYSVGGRISSEI